MARLAKSHDQMYDWVTYMWSPFLGCPHQCTYCYVKTATRDLPEKPIFDSAMPELGEGKTIFVGHLCDMFSEGLPPEEVISVLAHCNKNLNNVYVFQSKNPVGFFVYYNYLSNLNRMLGTTIETNREDYLKTISKAPAPQERAMCMKYLSKKHDHKFLTIEPILDFDLQEMLDLIIKADPEFVNIGADSKGHGLIEPSADKVRNLIFALGEVGITIQRKMNLERLV